MKVALVTGFIFSTSRYGASRCPPESETTKALSASAPPKPHPLPEPESASFHHGRYSMLRAVEYTGVAPERRTNTIPAQGGQKSPSPHSEKADAF